MHITKWKKAFWKIYTLHNSNSMTFWKRENYEDDRKVNGWQRFEGKIGYSEHVSEGTRVLGAIHLAKDRHLNPLSSDIYRMHFSQLHSANMLVTCMVGMPKRWQHSLQDVRNRGHGGHTCSKSISQLFSRRNTVKETGGSYYGLWRQRERTR